MGRWGDGFTGESRGEMRSQRRLHPCPGPDSSLPPVPHSAARGILSYRADQIPSPMSRI
jgi:hypothetical protein